MDWIVGINSQIYFATLDLVRQNTLNNCFLQSLSTSSQSCHIFFFTTSFGVLAFINLSMCFASRYHFYIDSQPTVFNSSETSSPNYPCFGMTILNFDVVWGLKGKSLWREICAKDCVPFESEMMVKGGERERETSHSSSTLPPLGFP